MFEALLNLRQMSLEKSAKNVYYRRNYRIYESKDAISVFKPAESRLWTVSAALRDAEETIAELLNVKIQKGLKDRYLTAKDYAGGNAWGGMIGYIVAGSHKEIVEKLNSQIDRQLKDPNAHLKDQPSVNNFDAIYASLHQHPITRKPLIITHLLLSFFDRLEKPPF